MNLNAVCFSVNTSVCLATTPGDFGADWATVTPVTTPTMVSAATASTSLRITSPFPQTVPPHPYHGERWGIVTGRAQGPSRRGMASS